MKLRVCLIGLIILSVFVSGCTLKAMYVGNDELEIKIAKDDKELARIKAENQKLEAEKQALLLQLKSRLAFLEQRLQENQIAEELIRKMETQTDEKRDSYDQLKQELEQYKHELAYGSNFQDQNAIAQKEDQIDELTRKIETYLKMGLD